jgi:hypothetical protein
MRRVESIAQNFGLHRYVTRSNVYGSFRLPDVGILEDPVLYPLVFRTYHVTRALQ